jgi:hypothetical protein
MPKRNLIVMSSSPWLKPYELGTALRRRIKEDFAGNLSAAARAAGISQPTFYRYANPSAARVGRELKQMRMKPVIARKLAAFLPASMRSDLLRSRQAGYALYLYTQWLGAALDRSGTKGLPHEGRIHQQSPEGVWIDRATEFGRLLARIGKEVPSVKQDITQAAGRVRTLDAETKQALAKLGVVDVKPHETMRKPVTSARFLLSLYRMVEPLLDSAASGWIELRGSELSKARLRQFAIASWKREAVTLERLGDIERLSRFEFDSIDKDPRLRPLKWR